MHVTSRGLIVLFTLALACALHPATAGAAGGVELTPTVGYRWGGEISASSTDIFDHNMEVRSSGAFGLMLDIPLSRAIQLELMADHQSSEFERGRLFEPSDPTYDVDVTYYHVGVLWQWHTKHLRPYAVASLGVARIDPDLPGARPEERFSGSLGGGVKVPISEHLDFRFEARGLWADTGSGHGWGDDDCHHWCSDYDEPFGQAQLKVGLTINF